MSAVDIRKFQSNPTKKTSNKKNAQIYFCCGIQFIRGGMFSWRFASQIKATDG
jgi:hypothetical protein